MAAAATVLADILSLPSEERGRLVLEHLRNGFLDADECRANVRHWPEKLESDGDA